MAKAIDRLADSAIFIFPPSDFYDARWQQVLFGSYPTAVHSVYREKELGRYGIFAGCLWVCGRLLLEQELINVVIMNTIFVYL